MRYAKVDGILSEPASGLKGICLGCEEGVIAKCGTIKTHHWAHGRRADCDSWWEPMTQWHLDWQNEFPKECREKIVRNDDNKEFHRADIQTASGLTIEFQYSPISASIIEKRNKFYQQLIWVVNGVRFKENFRLTCPIVNPESALLANHNFHVDKYGQAKVPLFYVKPEYLFGEQPDKVLAIDLEELDKVRVEQEKIGKFYWLFEWNYIHHTWMNCTAPVFLDFGTDDLYWIKRRVQSTDHLHYIQVVKKTQFLEKYCR